MGGLHTGYAFCPFCSCRVLRVHAFLGLTCTYNLHVQFVRTKNAYTLTCSAENVQNRTTTDKRQVYISDEASCISLGRQDLGKQIFFEPFKRYRARPASGSNILHLYNSRIGKSKTQAWVLSRYWVPSILQFNVMSHKSRWFFARLPNGLQMKDFQLNAMNFVLRRKSRASEGLLKFLWTWKSEYAISSIFKPIAFIIPTKTASNCGSMFCHCYSDV